jgi:gluconokinase
MTAFVLMGVAGTGKTTLGKLAAAALDLPFLEADEFHPPRNVARMAAGIALTDADRAPWIDALAHAVNAHGTDVIVACSALTRAVRARLRAQVGAPVHFLFLTAAPRIIEQRLGKRTGHFMKAGMLASQLAALQPPREAAVFDVARPRREIADEIVRHIRGHVARA